MNYTSMIYVDFPVPLHRLLQFPEKSAVLRIIKIGSTRIQVITRRLKHYDSFIIGYRKDFKICRPILLKISRTFH
jgi:hypothetical protein